MPAIKNEKFRIGASHTIGTCVLPGEIITKVHQEVNRRITLNISACNEIVKAVKARKIDMGFIELKIEDNALNCTPWMDDELVFCSKKQLPAALAKEELKQYRLLCAKVESIDRDVLDVVLLKQDVYRDDFNAIQELDNPTAIIQSIKFSNPHASVTPIGVVSKRAIEYELKYNHFYVTSINHAKILKKFYIVYRNDSAYANEISRICKKVHSH
ncbi:MAG: Transcriptional regulator, LysR family [uncultured Sulfurovum sp.]|uniref:Transcriptional regulator, LysR family n=1 Tax=uncultured Sulfurovum sp. TaxID=269237 RepID=A0A6S6SD85_9BACT|nr:MAG: Transcriptional regulator, LysR family [uncultured Sulfurovum sp.]